jgi:hypothetical protein
MAVIKLRPARAATEKAAGALFGPVRASLCVAAKATSNSRMPH